MVIHLPFSVAEKSTLKKVPLDFLRNFSKEVWIKGSALIAFQNMRMTAKKDGVELLVLSAWRSFEEQKWLFQDAEKRHGVGKGLLWVAPPGYSEHHTGYVLDIADGSRPETDDEPLFETTYAFAWLFRNAGRFGFKLSFPKNNWQNVSYEPWHWRYSEDDESKSIFYPPFYRVWLKILRGYMLTWYNKICLKR